MHTMHTCVHASRRAAREAAAAAAAAEEQAAAEAAAAAAQEEEERLARQQLAGAQVDTEADCQSQAWIKAGEHTCSGDWITCF